MVAQSGSCSRILMEGRKSVMENDSMGGDSVQIRIKLLPNTNTNRCCYADMFYRVK